MTCGLIFAMYAALSADNDFSAVSLQEFSSEENSETAKVQFDRDFQTAKSIRSAAICVQK